MTSIVYIDTSAILKEYLGEDFSQETVSFLRKADFLGSSVLLKVEFTSGIAKAIRMGWINPEVAQQVFSLFNTEVADLHLISVDQTIINRAAELAWQFGLRGYDAVHLASAWVWQEDLGEMVTLATFDRPLKDAAQQMGLKTWPLQVKG